MYIYIYDRERAHSVLARYGGRDKGFSTAINSETGNSKTTSTASAVAMTTSNITSQLLLIDYFTTGRALESSPSDFRNGS